VHNTRDYWNFELRPSSGILNRSRLALSNGPNRLGVSPLTRGRKQIQFSKRCVFRNIGRGTKSKNPVIWSLGVLVVTDTDLCCTNKGKRVRWIIQGHSIYPIYWIFLRIFHSPIRSQFAIAYVVKANGQLYRYIFIMSVYDGQSKSSRNSPAHCILWHRRFGAPWVRTASTECYWSFPSASFAEVARYRSKGAARPPLGSTQPPIKWVPGALSRG
jgi:hypothetical protein